MLVLIEPPVSVRTRRTSNTSQVGVGEHGVFLPHSAETLDGVHKLLIVHELLARRTKTRVELFVVFIPNFVRISPHVPHCDDTTLHNICALRNVARHNYCNCQCWLDVKTEQELRTKAKFLNCSLECVNMYEIAA